MSLPSQTAGKSSRADWIGILPSHWDEVRLKHGLRLITEKASEDTFKVALENIESWSGRYIETETAFEGDGTAFQRGDLLFGKLRPYLAKALLADAPGQAVGDFHVLRPAAEVHGRFALYYVLSRDFIAVVDGSTYGAKMPRASWDFMSNLPLPLPPLAEQAAIVAFLDRETGKIDALVEEQRRLIELLKEKRQAIITNAVTKGLDPTVKMKQSGVTWLGEVPSHWEVHSLSRVTLDKCDGPFGSGLKSEHYSDAGVRVVRLQNIRAGAFDGTDSAFVDEAYHRVVLRGGHDVVGGDLLIAGLGDDNNPVGRACVAPESIGPAMVKADCFRFRIDARRSDVQFLARQLSAGSYFDAGQLSSGSTRSRIPLSTMSSRIVALPPIEEQREIAHWLEQALAKIDRLQEEAANAASLLSERRAALISAAVTGKIDVREAVTDQEDAA